MESVTYKVITLGNYGVGKTCLLLRAVDEKCVLASSYMCTIGVDFKTKIQTLNGEEYKLMIWDTAGQEQFYHINRLYYSGCDAVLLVYDITNLQSFEKINYFRQDFENYSEGKLPMILVANKSDSRDRQVTTEQGSELAKILSIPFVECSALTGAQVNKIFEILLEEIIKKNPKESTNLTGSFVINTTVKQPKRNKQCCFDN